MWLPCDPVDLSCRHIPLADGLATGPSGVPGRPRRGRVLYRLRLDVVWYPPRGCNFIGTASDRELLGPYGNPQPSCRGRVTRHSWSRLFSSIPKLASSPSSSILIDRHKTLGELTLRGSCDPAISPTFSKPGLKNPHFPGEFIWPKWGFPLDQIHSRPIHLELLSDWRRKPIGPCENIGGGG